MSYEHKDTFTKWIRLGEHPSVRLEIVHWTSQWPVEWGGVGVDCDLHGLKHNYNVYVYAYNGCQLMVDILNHRADLPFNGGETYRLHQTHKDGNSVCVGDDYNHIWDHVSALGLYDGEPPDSVQAGAQKIEDYIIEHYKQGGE